MQWATQGMCCTESGLIILRQNALKHQLDVHSPYKTTFLSP